MNQKRGNNMLIVCFLRKTLMFTNIPPDAKKNKEACNLCKTYELYWSEKGNLGCKIVHQQDIMIRPTHELPFPLITIVAGPQPGDT